MGVRKLVRVGSGWLGGWLRLLDRSCWLGVGSGWLGLVGFLGGWLRLLDRLVKVG